eukprot:TRINITY_DN45273_c0_g1_i1.p1 TRINITY_DN45273_c0_g1~~TRINITY_DN45273_c0_g1_i1.p1  ORF type:complete len:119 (+),score=15.77 TRINITY_DN45273_c0_g1_i1:40-357(+)
MERINPDTFMLDVQRDNFQQIIRSYAARINYSEKYTDDTNEYRHVILPKELARILPKGKVLAEREWRAIGVQQSLGWEMYMVHRPEPHVLCFRRPLGFQPPTHIA